MPNSRKLSGSIFSLVLCAVILGAGCAESGYEKISASDFVNYGDTPLSHTVYVGSDTEYHYFVWSSGKAGGKWQVEKSQMPFRAEMPLGEVEAFLIEDDNGRLQPFGIQVAPSST